jgi:hypothetical protein
LRNKAKGGFLLLETIQREAQQALSSGRGQGEGNQKMLNTYLILLSPALSIRRGSNISATYGLITDSLNSNDLLRNPS